MYYYIVFGYIWYENYKNCYIIYVLFSGECSKGRVKWEKYLEDYFENDIRNGFYVY